MRMAPSRIIMVSCNPATMARDAAILREMGYDLQCYRPVDLSQGQRIVRRLAYSQNNDITRPARIPLEPRPVFFIAFSLEY